MMNINKKEQELVNEILECFDFKHTHRAMSLLKWKWVHSLEINKVPSVEEIKKEALNRILSAIEIAKESKDPNPNTNYFSSSGGFRAVAWKNRYGQITNLELLFILDEWMSGDD